MDLKRYLDYKTNQLFKQKSIHNFDIAVLVPVRENAALVLENASVLCQNGVDVVFLLAPQINKDIVLAQIKGRMTGNWIVISCQEERLSLPAVCRIATERSSRKYILMVTDLRDLRSLTVGHMDRMRILGRFYKNHFLSVNLEGFVGLFAERKMFSVERFPVFEDYRADSEFLFILERFMELRGFRRLAVVGTPGQKEDECEGKCRIWYEYFTSSAGKTDSCPEYEAVFDYRDNVYKQELLAGYLSRFDSFKLFDPEFDRKTFRKIVLVQSYNEIETIKDFLRNMGEYFDGIILLDDSSDDGTYEAARHDKILLKVKKKRSEFNDVENRNTLLSLASFFNARWFCFMDVDEQIDPRFSDFGTIENDPDTDVVAFNRVHLWNDESLFNASYPGSYAGVEKVFRMFRNIGLCRINTEKKYHFAATPYFENQCINSEILMLHYGVLTKEKRKKKYDFYTQNDPLGTMRQYLYLISPKSVLKEIKSIRLQDLISADTAKYIWVTK